MKPLLTALVLLATPLMALTEYTTLQEAIPAAQQQKKAIMLNFTGTDWCTACIHLRKKILDTKEFDAAMGDKLVLVEVDYPRTPELVNKISKEEWKEREALLVSYRAQGLPFAVLMDENGYPFATINGTDRTTDDYLKRIRQALAVRGARDAALSKAKAYSGYEHAKALTTALELLPESCRDKYPEQLKAVAAADPEDKLGYHRYLGGSEARIKQMNELRELMAKFVGQFSTEQIHANIAALDQFLSKPGLDPEVRQEALRAKADSYAFLRDIPAMLQTMKEARDAAPNSRLGQKLSKNIEYTEANIFPQAQQENNEKQP